jgi:hypothetical protein
MELSHTLEVNPNWFIRFFIWFYDLPRRDPDLNTCKLFWGTIGIAVIPPILLVLSPIIAVVISLSWFGNRVTERRRNKRRQELNAFYALSLEEREALVEQKSSRSENLERFAAWAGAVWFKVQGPVTWFFRLLIGAIVLGALAVGIVVLINIVPGLPWGDILSLAWKAVLGAMAVVGVAFLLAKAFLAWQARRPVKPVPAEKPKKPSVIRAVFASIHDHTCANIKVTGRV